MLQFTPCVCLALALSGPLDSESSSSMAPPLPRLNLVWSDSHRLFRYGFQIIADEVEEIFRTVGIEAQMGRDAVSPYLYSFEIVIYLRSSTPPDWNLGDGAMGAVVPGRHPRRAVYIFFQNVLATLALDYRPTARLPTATETQMLARALARVAAHEVVHSVAPDVPHAQTGLMKRRLTKKHLTAPRLRLSPRSAVALRSDLPQPFLIAMRKTSLGSISIP